MPIFIVNVSVVFIIIIIIIVVVVLTSLKSYWYSETFVFVDIGQ